MRLQCYWAGNLLCSEEALYFDGAHQPEMMVALIWDGLMAIAFVSFLD
jgi:hypothetical protein